jgi:malate/lactate dehydrogenase
LSASAHSKVVIFTVNSLGSSESYLDVVQSNVDLFRALVPALGHYSQHGVLLVASQPGKMLYFKLIWWFTVSVELPLQKKSHEILDYKEMDIQ